LPQSEPAYAWWSIGLRPIIAAPCPCESAFWWRDEDGCRCVKCGRRPPIRSRTAARARAPRGKDFRIEQL